MNEPLSTVVLILTLLVMVIGLVGIVLPMIPGTLVIWGAAFIYALVEGFQAVGWPTLILLGLLAIVATTADIWASSIGAKMGGASGWSVVLGLIGGLVGFVLFSLLGAIVGAVFGVLLTEIIRVGDWRQALKAGSGWMVGWVLATVVQLTIGLIMMAIFVWQITQGA